MRLESIDKTEALKVILSKIIKNTYNNILLEMRFLDVALSNLEPEAKDDIEYLSTDGKKIYYNELKMIETFKQNPQKVAHDIVHVLFHCILLHLFYTKIKIPMWDLACDIAVAQIICSMDLNCFRLSNDTEKRDKLSFFEQNVKPFTPQNVLKFLQEQNYNEEEVQELEKLFEVDTHDDWENAHKKPEEDEDDEQTITITLVPISWDDLAKIWTRVGNIVLINMQSFSKLQGDKASNLRQKLEELSREQYDYSKFLKKFAVRKEVNKINDDEFDYIFYTYGLNMYKEKRMPLIEPLEYKDELVIRDFVIAIDTSGSTSGDTVQKFLQKTYNILKSTESFTKKVNIYIIQCDADIQEVKLITSELELEDYITNLEIKGLGGTDFRPVFTLVNSMIKEKKFTKLKGLIYFTDGYGEFPQEKTTYDTAFVFIEKEDFLDVTVPAWSMKVLLTEEQILEFKG